MSTRDGVLVARHENEISGTTDVGSRPRFAGRETTKVIDGQTLTGWFTEDFTLAELRTLRARDSAAAPGQHGLRRPLPGPDVPGGDRPHRAPSRELRRDIGIDPETKHPTYFRSIGLALEGPLVRTLRRNRLDGRRDKVFVQSFETSNFKALNQTIDTPLVRLLGSKGSRPLRSSEDAAADGTRSASTRAPTGWASTGFSDHPDTAVEARRALRPRARQVAGSLLRRATSRVDCPHDSRTSHRRPYPGRDPVMFDGLLYPLRLPERALGAIGQIVEDVSGLRRELAGGLGTLEQTVDSLAADVHPLRTDVAVMRDSTSRLPEGMAKLEQAVTGLGSKLDHVQNGVGNLHADMTELCAHVEGLGRQLDTLQQKIDAIHSTVDDVAKDIPGASGTGAIAKVRDAMGRGSS